MRFGNTRGVTLAAGLVPALLLAIGLSSTPAHAQDFHAIPRTVDAIDLNTGGPYYAPPVPYGHYAKDPVGMVSNRVHGLLGRLHGAGTGCGLCGGRGCAACMGAGDPTAGGCATCGTGGLFGNHHGLGSGCGLCGGRGCGACIGHATTIVASAQGIPSSQAPVIASPQCGDPGCSLLGKHHHKGCGLCRGTGICGGRACGGCAVADPCSACGGRGCGLCGGASGLLGSAHGMVNHLLGRDKIKWFVGPGGPVPLTPGYVPYVNVTRSPREFFAFPPMTP